MIATRKQRWVFWRAHKSRKSPNKREYVRLKKTPTLRRSHWRQILGVFLHFELLQLYELPSNTSLHSALSHTALADTIALKPHLYGTSIKLVKLLCMKLNFHMKLNCVRWHTFSRIQNVGDSKEFFYSFARIRVHPQPPFTDRKRPFCAICGLTAETFTGKSWCA